MANCNCDGYPFPHKMGSGKCVHNHNPRVMGVNIPKLALIVGGVILAVKFVLPAMQPKAN